MKGYVLGICFLFFVGCTQQPTIGDNINCSSNSIAQYSLDSLERDYVCKKVEEVQE